jgi:hypothetical protein
MKFVITTFDINAKPIMETTRGTKEGLDTVLETVVRDMNDIWTDVDSFTVQEKDAA